MGFKNFRLNCTIRVVLLAATLGVTIYIYLETELYATVALITGLAVLQIWGLIHYVDKSNRDLARFLLSVEYGDFTATFPNDKKGGAHQELREALESVLRQFRQARSEKQEQYRYLQTVVQHISVGLISADQDGRIDLFNNAAKRLLGVSGARHLDDLARVSPALVEKLKTIEPRSKELCKIELPGETVQVSLAATEFKLSDRSIRLFSLQNITSELAEREMEAWQQLVRVLTHEIMNSITPITSLAGTSRRLLESGQVKAGGDLSDLSSAIATIERRSEGLLRFVEAYRSLTKVPRPKFQIVRIDDLLSRIARLIANHPNAGGVAVSVECNPASLELTADPDLIEQVLINLATNAVQALEGLSDARIELSAHINERGRVIIEVHDNGSGISPEALESVFVPFFTTKKDGTGIGLSLSRQIMRLHKGDISAVSHPGEGATFVLRF
jgi:two-component system, NtrC family, nitrogen regulation sensor histidine kinase NtrY